IQCDAGGQPRSRPSKRIGIIDQHLDLKRENAVQQEVAAGERTIGDNGGVVSRLRRYDGRDVIRICHRGVRILETSSRGTPAVSRQRKATVSAIGGGTVWGRSTRQRAHAKPALR